jgi:hypothetical protein
MILLNPLLDAVLSLVFRRISAKAVEDHSCDRDNDLDRFLISDSADAKVLLVGS